MKPFELSPADGVLTGSNPFSEVMRAFTVGKGAAPVEKKMVRPPAWENAPVEKLLNWIQCVWTEEVINLRDIDRHGPAGFRGHRNHALETAKILEAHGWLILDDDVRQHNMRKWRIIRKTVNGAWNPALAQLSPRLSQLSR